MEVYFETKNKLVWVLFIKQIICVCIHETMGPVHESVESRGAFWNSIHCYCSGDQT